MGVFDFEVRVLVCPQCAAPLQVAAQGGLTSCGYCGQTSNFMPRPTQQVFAAGREVLDEPGRLARLQAQVSDKDEPPAELTSLLATQLSGDRLNEAERRIAEQRAQPASPHRDRLLYWLTVALYNTYFGPANAVRQRALIETAIEIVADPRRKASLVGMLARNAARAGETDAAWQWVSSMDPASESLAADTAYRLSRAYVSTARQDFADVLAVLRPGIGEIPLGANELLMCGVLRANAHERQGRVGEAGAHLRAYFEHNPALIGLVDQIVAANPTLHLCTQSLVLARA